MAISGQKTVTAAGTAVQLGSGACMVNLMIKALATNTGLVFVGNDGADVTSATGQELDAGEYLVIEGSCTHLGCAPLAEFEVGPADDWFGGFFCPCHGSRFDLSGRVYKGVPAPTNLRVPPYRFIREDVIMIGSDAGAA